jgi:hypothetical protein
VHRSILPEADKRPIPLDDVVSFNPRFSVVLVAAIVGCGGFGYHQFAVIDPDTRADSSIVIASLRLRIHVADERIDVRLENAGVDTIVVEWTSASFTISVSPGDEIPHRLVRSAMLADGASMNNGSRAVAFAAPAYVAAPYPDQGPQRLPPDDERFTIAPHDVREETLYPAEHVRARSDGRWIVGPLFCKQSSRAQRRVTVSFAAMIGARWRTISVQGIVSR